MRIFFNLSETKSLECFVKMTLPNCLLNLTFFQLGKERCALRIFFSLNIIDINKYTFQETLILMLASGQSNTSLDNVMMLGISLPHQLHSAGIGADLYGLHRGLFVL